MTIENRAEKLIMEQVEAWLPSTKILKKCLVEYNKMNSESLAALVEKMERWKKKDRLELVSVDWTGRFDSYAGEVCGNEKEALDMLLKDIKWLNEAYPVAKALYPKSGLKRKGFTELQSFFLFYINKVMGKKIEIDSDLLVVASSITRAWEAVYSTTDEGLEYVSLCEDILEPYLEGKSNFLEVLLEHNVLTWEELTSSSAWYWTKPGLNKVGVRALKLCIKECMPYLILHTGQFYFYRNDFVGFKGVVQECSPELAETWAQELAIFAQRGAREANLVRHHINVLVQSADAPPTNGCLANVLLEQIAANEQKSELQREITSLYVGDSGQSVSDSLIRL